MVESIVVDETQNAVEAAVANEVADAAVEEVASSSTTGAIIAGVISIFSIIGLATVVKKICAGINKGIQKIKDKKAAKQRAVEEAARAAAKADALQHPENYYTEADVKAEEEVVEE